MSAQPPAASRITGPAARIVVSTERHVLSYVIPERSSKVRRVQVRNMLEDAIADKSKISRSEPPAKAKDPAAVSLGRRGGRKGGPARARKLSPERRREIARKAAEARWAKQRQEGAR